MITGFFVVIGFLFEANSLLNFNSGIGLAQSADVNCTDNLVVTIIVD